MTTFVLITVTCDASFPCNTDQLHAPIGVNKQFHARLYLFVQMQGTSVLTLPQPCEGLGAALQKLIGRRGRPEQEPATPTPHQWHVPRQVQTAPGSSPIRARLPGSHHSLACVCI